MRDAWPTDNSPARDSPYHDALVKRLSLISQGGLIHPPYALEQTMPQTFDLVLKGGTIVNQDGSHMTDIGVSNGRIAALGNLGQTSAGRVIDARGLHILPGVIDTQVHFREPGLTHKEDLETGSRAAVLGGVTGVFEMPNTNPQTTTPQALAAKVAAGHHRMHCDFAFWVGGTYENVGDVAELERLPGAAGIKVFMGSSTGSLLVADDAGVTEILKRTKRRAAFHSEDEERLKARMHLRRKGDPSSHPEWRDVETAMSCTRRLIAIARKTGACIHVLHISTADEIAYLQDFKDIASCEATPHHLTLVAPDCYNRLGAYAQMNPPVRDEPHRKGIWAGIANGTVDVLGSDHAPHTREEKDHVYPDTHSGMTGVQTLVPIMLDHVNAGRLTLERFVDLTSHGPNRLFGIAGKGRIAAGYDADFTIVDMQRRQTISNDWIASRCGWTPYDGVSVNGWPIGTMVRGHVVMWDGEITEPGLGEAIQFQETVGG
jgi:dihydroorotase